MFKVGTAYSKEDIYSALNVPVESRRGNWDTGYTKFKNDWFFFCNVGVAGRTGHDYENRFDGDNLISYSKKNSKIEHDSIKNISSPNVRKFLFYREDDMANWTFAGLGTLVGSVATSPVRFTWAFYNLEENRAERLPEELIDSDQVYFEGARKVIVVNKYERNIQARQRCISVHGLKCCVCEFDFEKVWGEIGRDFIHVHHLREVSAIGEEYILDPVRDLRPLCPNCHAMIHRRKPAFLIEELRLKLKK